MRTECIGMILAGGKGERLGALTYDLAKPCVSYGGKHKIIDFTLSNCSNSGISDIGVLTQYRPLTLHDYIGNGSAWKLDGGVRLLPSYRRGRVYKGTSNAVYQNFEYIEELNPEYVIVLSGDHVYKMDYSKMLDFHKKTGADATIAVTPVPVEDAPMFGIMAVDGNDRITEFEEKPVRPKSNLASMGVYIFSFKNLKRYLMADERDPCSANDFGRNIIPGILSAGEKLFAYRFDGYWKDIGTVQSLWGAHMDLLSDSPSVDLRDRKWEVYTKSNDLPLCQISDHATINYSIVGGDCNVYGKVDHSVLFNSVVVGEYAEVRDSVIMPNVIIAPGAKIRNAVIASNVIIGEWAEVGTSSGIDIFVDEDVCARGVSLIGSGTRISDNMKFSAGSHIYRSSYTFGVYAERDNTFATALAAHAAT